MVEELLAARGIIVSHETQGGLAAAGRAEQSDKLGIRHMQVDPLEC
jgi:hypothetical protein